MTVRINPGIAVGVLDDIIRHKALVLLRHRIVISPANQAFDGKERALRVGHTLALGWLAHKALAIICKSNNRRRCARALCILDHPWGRAIHDGHARVGCS